MTLKEKIVQLLRTRPGLTDRQITDALFTPGAPQQPVNGACRALEADGNLVRRKGVGPIRSYLQEGEGVANPQAADRHTGYERGPAAPPDPQRDPERSDGADIDRLIKIGFRRAGRWVLRDARPVAEIDSDAPISRNVLYAFVIAGKVRYIGKTTLGLQRRLYGYQNPGPTQRTNIRNHDRIKTVLGDGERVDIYVMPDPGLHAFGEFQINLAAGLEDSIIRTLKPEWNGS